MVTYTSSLIYQCLCQTKYINVRVRYQHFITALFITVICVEILCFLFWLGLQLKAPSRCHRHVHCDIALRTSGLPDYTKY